MKNQLLKNKSEHTQCGHSYANLEALQCITVTRSPQQLVAFHVPFSSKHALEAIVWRFDSLPNCTRWHSSLDMLTSSVLHDHLMPVLQVSPPSLAQFCISTWFQSCKSPFRLPADWLTWLEGISIRHSAAGVFPPHTLARLRNVQLCVQSVFPH